MPAISIAELAGAAVTGYVTTASPSLNMRSSPSTTAGITGSLPYRSALAIDCQTTGSMVGTSSIWDRLSNSSSISDWWTITPMTGGFSPGIPRRGAAPTPPPAVNLRAQTAASWAIAERNSRFPTWSDQLGTSRREHCEAFVEIAYGRSITRYGSAAIDYNAMAAMGRIHRDDQAPAGALVFYAGGSDGHVALSIGGGQVVSTIGYVGNRYPVQQVGIHWFSNPYLGWAMPVGV